MAWQVKRTKRALKSLTLTSEQQTTFDEAAEKLTAEMSELEQMGLTQEMRKARSEKQNQVENRGSKARNSRPTWWRDCLLYTSPSPRDKRQSRMPSSA